MSKILFTIAVIFSAIVCGARTGGVSVTESGGGSGPSLILSFTDHAHETNGLWVAFGSQDRGGTTNGWEYVAFLTTVYPETTSYEYQLPAGWGGVSFRAARFFLSEVPYAGIDYTTEYLFSGKGSSSTGQFITLDDFTFYGTDRVRARVKFQSTTLSRAQGIFCARNGDGGGAPYFNVFCLQSGLLRFDYNTTVGASGNGLGTTALAVDTIYEIEASSAGLLLNGNQEASCPGTEFDSTTAGTPFLFVGKTTSPSSQAKMYLYRFQVYNQGGALRMNLIPAAKDGVGGVYDTVRDRFYSGTVKSWSVAFEPGPRVEAENPFFTNAVYLAEKSTGASVFAAIFSATDVNAYTNAEGGVLVGPADLTLTGMNDFGGQFSVSNGTLLAGFGQGLALTDNLRLAGGTWGGWNGSATNTIGSAGGQLSFDDVLPGGWSAAAGALAVNIGGEGASWTYAGKPATLILNDANAKGTLTFESPIALNDGTILNVKNTTAPVVFAREITGQLTSSGGSVYTYGDEAASGRLMFLGATNLYKTFYQYGGNTVFGTNTYTRLGGNFYVEGGTVLLTNAIVTMTGEANYYTGVRINAGHVNVMESAVSTRYLEVGKAEEWAGSSITVDGSSLNVAKNLTIMFSAQSQAFTMQGNANVKVGGDLSLQRRNFYQYGGSNDVTGGIIDMSAASVARYSLLGGYLSVTNVSRKAGTKYREAYFVFNGGTLNVRGTNSQLFLNFDEMPASGSASRVEIGGAGGTIEMANDMSIAVPLMNSTFVSSTWMYGPEDYLTAPAFVKRGAGTLTLEGANAAYPCATDVAEGTLKLAADVEAALPTNTVVRLTGGTLDLGGNAVEVRALTGSGSGTVTNGTLRVREGVYPGGAGTIGVLRVDAAVTGPLYVDVQANEDDVWESDLLTAGNALDLAGLDLNVTGLGAVPKGVKTLRIVSGSSYTGRFKSVTNVSGGWGVSYGAAGVTLQRPGLMVLLL